MIEALRTRDQAQVPAMSDEEAKQKLIDAGRILEAEGQGDLTRGHVSVRVPGDAARFYMKPHSYGFDEITTENIVVCNLDGEKIGGGGRRHSEVYIHSEIYTARPDVNSVIHAHPTYAVALSATGHAVRPISQPGSAFKAGVQAGDMSYVATNRHGRKFNVVYCDGSARTIDLPELWAAKWHPTWNKPNPLPACPW